MLMAAIDQLPPLQKMLAQGVVVAALVFFVVFVLVRIAHIVSSR